MRLRISPAARATPTRSASILAAKAFKALPTRGEAARRRVSERYLDAACRHRLCGGGTTGCLTSVLGLELDTHELPRRLVPLVRGARWGVEERNDVRVVVRDGVHVIHRVVCGIVHVLLRFHAGREAPAAVEVVVRRLAVHEADSHSTDGNHVRCDAAAVTRRERLDLI